MSQALGACAGFAVAAVGVGLIGVATITTHQASTLGDIAERLPTHLGSAAGFVLLSLLGAAVVVAAQAVAVLAPVWRPRRSHTRV